MPSITLTRAEAQSLVDFCKANNSERYFVAKDDGAYLGYSKGKEPEKQCIFYFKGCDPKKNPDTFWENGQRMFGGDDFGEHHQVGAIVEMLSHPEVVKVKFTLTPRQFKIEGLTR